MSKTFIEDPTMTYLFLLRMHSLLVENAPRVLGFKIQRREKKKKRKTKRMSKTRGKIYNQQMSYIL
jgi:hypothetical protein